MRASAPSHRRAVAVESFQTAAACIGPVEPGMSLFAITRGQFSMVDAVLHVLDQCGPSRLSIWTWTIAEYEISVFTALMRDARLTSARLCIDEGGRGKYVGQGARGGDASIVREWKQTFGPESVRYIRNHAKIATVEGGGRRVLLRGSMNLNFNARFEQLDVTEGGPDFDLVREIEDEFPILPDDCSIEDTVNASRVAEAFNPEQLAMFAGVKTWAK